MCEVKTGKSGEREKESVQSVTKKEVPRDNLMVLSFRRLLFSLSLLHPVTTQRLLPSTASGVSLRVKTLRSQEEGR